VREKAVPDVDERRGERVDDRRLREQHLERVRIGAQRLPDRLADLPVRLRAINRDEVERRIDQARRPWKRQDEHAAPVLVTSLVGDPPGTRADERVEHDARPQLIPRRRPALGVAGHPELAGHHLGAEVAGLASIEEDDLDLVSVEERRDATAGALRPDLAVDDAIDARRDLGPGR
jgi:hypothetical protein